MERPRAEQKPMRMASRRLMRVRWWKPEQPVVFGVVMAACMYAIKVWAFLLGFGVCGGFVFFRVSAGV